MARVQQAQNAGSRLQQTQSTQRNASGSSPARILLSMADSWSRPRDGLRRATGRLSASRRCFFLIINLLVARLERRVVAVSGPRLVPPVLPRPLRLPAGGGQRRIGVAP